MGEHTELAELSEAVRLLEQARSLPEVLKLHATAQAAEVYARAEKLGGEAEGYAREVRVRAARRSGEILLDMEERGERVGSGDMQNARQVNPVVVQGLPQGDQQKPVTLAELGVTKEQSSRWRKIAQVPEEVFEEAVSAGKSEKAIEREQRQRAPVRSIPSHTRKTAGGLVSVSGYKRRGPAKGSGVGPSLRGLQHAAAEISALAEALDAGALGDWPKLYGLPAAEQWFDVIEEALPRLNARLKRVLKDRRSA